MTQISIQPTSGKGDAVIFPAPADPWVSHQLWVFLAENLRPGFTVTIGVNGGRALSQASGVKLTAAEYAAVMDGAGGEGGAMG